MGSHEGEPPTRERMPGVTRPLSHTLRTRVADGSHVLRPCAEALRGAHVQTRHLRGPAPLGTLEPRVSRAVPSYLRLRAPPFSASSFIFTFFHPPFLSPEEPHVRAERGLLPFQPITAWLPPYWPSPRVPQQMGCERLYLGSRVAGKLSNESARSVYAGGGTCGAARVWEGGRGGTHRSEAEVGRLDPHRQWRSWIPTGAEPTDPGKRTRVVCSPEDDPERMGL